MTMPERTVKLTKKIARSLSLDFRSRDQSNDMTAISFAVIARQRSNADSDQLTCTELITGGQKNGGDVEKGGALQNPPVHCGRSRTLPPETQWGGATPTPGGPRPLHPILGAPSFCD